MTNTQALSDDYRRSGTDLEELRTVLLSFSKSSWKTRWASGVCRKSQIFSTPSLTRL